MSDLDKQIGQNVATYRGAMSQIELARRMRDLGWKWGQNTVSAVEVGDRPLRLGEAGDLARIFGLAAGASVLLRADGYTAVTSAVREVRAAKAQLHAAAEHYLDAQANLAFSADAAGITDEEAIEGMPGVVSALLSLNPHESVRDWEESQLEESSEFELESYRERLAGGEQRYEHLLAEHRKRMGFGDDGDSNG